MSFDPAYPHALSPLPPPALPADTTFGRLLIDARVEMAELKGVCGQIPNPLLLAAPASLPESVASSGIENIITSVAQVLQLQLFPEAEQRPPEKEVMHYREAMEWGFGQLSSFPLSSRVITGIQARLLPDGSGAYRREQNRIVNHTTLAPVYTPPPANEIPRLISNWEKYVNAREGETDPLIRAIVAHYQFEAIHPFRDGNGRTGRILLLLQVVQSGLLNLPILFLSGYIHRNRDQYYRSLRAVTTAQDWQAYIEYMLTGFYLQARHTRQTLEKMIALYHQFREDIRTNAKKIYSAELVEALFTFPVLSPVKLAGLLGKHYTTTSHYLAQLARMGILREAVVGKYHLFANYQLIELLGQET